MLEAPPAERGQMIRDELPTGWSPTGSTAAERELDNARVLSGIINTVISDYINLKIVEDNSRTGGSILNPVNMEVELTRMMTEFAVETESSIDVLFSEMDSFLGADGRNIYELSGTRGLALSNKITRHISTKMGLLWERLASLSPYAINPEEEFGNLKIKGIDLIGLNSTTGTLEYMQLKTLKATLTGSQTGRSVTELNLHNDPVFCAALDAPRNWTFPNIPSIPRVSGAGFWSRIGMDYQQVLRLAIELVERLDAYWTGLLR